MNHIHPTAVIYPNVELGDNIFIGAYSVIGAPAEHPDIIDPRQDQKFRVVIGDNAVIREHVTINSGTENDTVIFDDCYIMSHSHIGHDCTIQKAAVLHTGCIIGGHSVVGSYSKIGLGAVLHQRTKLHTGTMVGAQAFVKNGTENNFRILAGVPAKDIGDNWRMIEKLKDQK